MEFIPITLGEILWEFVLNFLVGHLVADSGVDLVERFPRFSRGVDERRRLLSSFVMRRPNTQFRDLFFFDELAQSLGEAPTTIG